MNSMLKVIKTGLVYVLSIAITIVLAMYVDLIEKAKKYGFYIINDNAYSDIIFDGLEKRKEVFRKMSGMANCHSGIPIANHIHICR